MYRRLMLLIQGSLPLKVQKVDQSSEEKVKLGCPEVDIRFCCGSVAQSRAPLGRR